MRTLHFYFGRELVKTFLMTAAALSMLIVMGGGLGNIFLNEGIGAAELAKVFLYLTPVAVTLILPISALFSATITYGRAASDNEVLACSAAGINVHRLMVPPFLLGLAVTAATYLSWNYLVPHMMGAIHDFVRQDPSSFVWSQFQKGKPLSFQDYHLAANECRRLGAQDLGAEVSKDYLKTHIILQLSGVSFLEFDDETLLRFGTADRTLIVFDRSGSSPRVTADLQEVRSFDEVHRQYYEFEHQVLGPMEIPVFLSRKIKYENLSRLLAYRRNPWLIEKMAAHQVNLRGVMFSFFLNQNVEEHMARSGDYRLIGEGFEILIRAAMTATGAEDGRIQLKEVEARVVRTAESGAPADVYRADLAMLELQKGKSWHKPFIVVELIGNVEVRREPAGPSDRPVRKAKETLSRVAFADQPELKARFEDYDVTRLFTGEANPALFRKQREIRDAIARDLRKYSAEVLGEIHFRASYSLGAIAIVVLGAMLGIIVRGGQVLTAFGISTVPMLFVIVASIVGRNLVDREGYTAISICVMWGAMILMYGAAFFVGTKVLKR